jgi:hypothetical protein
MNEIVKFCLQILIHCSVGLSGAALRPCRSEGQRRRRRRRRRIQKPQLFFGDLVLGVERYPSDNRFSRLSYQIAVSKSMWVCYR